MVGKDYSAVTTGRLVPQHCWWYKQLVWWSALTQAGCCRLLEGTQRLLVVSWGLCREYWWHEIVSVGCCWMAVLLQERKAVHRLSGSYAKLGAAAGRG
jgi:hypothetical protein